jgi:hypothetical protein
MMNSPIHSTSYQELAEELSAMLGYDVVNNLQDLELSELDNLRESLSSIEAYLNLNSLES